MKHVDALKSTSVWASIVTTILHLTMIGIKKHGVGSKDMFEPISLDNALRFSFMVLTETRHAHFSIALVADW
jgi:hypothetical protein